MLPATAPLRSTVLGLPDNYTVPRIVNDLDGVLDNSLNLDMEDRSLVIAAFIDHVAQLPDLSNANMQCVFCNIIAHILSLPTQMAVKMFYFALTALEPVSDYHEIVFEISKWLLYFYHLHNKFDRISNEPTAFHKAEHNSRKHNFSILVQTTLQKATDYFVAGEILKARDIFNSLQPLITVLSLSDSNTRLGYLLRYSEFLGLFEEYGAVAELYMEIWHLPIISNDFRIYFLQLCVSLTIISKPGRQKTRMLALLVRNKTFQKMNTYKIIEKTYFQRFIYESEIIEYLSIFDDLEIKFSKSLCRIRVLMEHNLLSASKLYNNVTFERLGQLLKTDPTDLQLVASNLIRERHLNATVDQIDGIVYFENCKVKPTWEEEIRSFCYHVNKISNKIVEEKLKN